jgi:hypothetical protein
MDIEENPEKGSIKTHSQIKKMVPITAGNNRGFAEQLSVWIFHLIVDFVRQDLF